MPQRSPAHQLEEQSRNAFRSALPSEWIPRDLQPDYGLDMHVELADPQGQLSGLAFYVQLKATGRSLAKLNVQLPRGHWEYYRSVDLPVLLVRYHQPSDSLYFRWIHSFDPNPRPVREPSDRTSEKSVTFGFSTNSQWTDESPIRLAADVEALRRIREGRVALPVTVLVAPQTEEDAPAAAHVAMAMRNAVVPHRNLMRVTTTPVDAGGPRVVVASDRTRVDLAGLASVTMYPIGDPQLAAASVADIAVSIARNYALVRQDVVAARLALPFFASSHLAANVHFAALLATSFVRSQLIAEALDVAGRLARRDDAASVSTTLFEMTVMSAQQDLSAEQLGQIEQRLRHRIEGCRSAGGQQLAGAEYSLANYLRMCRRHQEALEWYDAAKRSDPGYDSRVYFNHERGGSLFLTNRFLEASTAYRRALELGAAHMTPALCADALLYAGRYAEAQEVFNDYIVGDTVRDAEWRLKRQLIPIVRNIAGDTQQREIEAAMRLADVTGIASEEERQARLEDALRLDGLCALAWFNLGVLRQAGDRSEVRDLFLLAALLMPGDVESWLNALWCTSEPAVAKDIFVTAYRFDGQHFLDHLWQHQLVQLPGFPLDDMTSLVNTWLEELEPEGRGRFSVRFLGPDGSYESVQFRTGEE